MTDIERRSGAVLIAATDAGGRAVAVPIGSVLAVTPDPSRQDRTRLHTAGGIVSVDGGYESWMDRLSSDWTTASSS